MSKILDKMLSFVGWEEEVEQDEVEEIQDEQQFSYSPSESYLKSNRENSRNRNKVVNIHTAGHFKVVIVQPENFEQAREITEHLKNRKPVIANVEGLEKYQAQRIVDFLSGSVYALNGNIQRVSNGIFLIAPQNVDILGGIETGSDEKSIFSWTR